MLHALAVVALVSQVQPPSTLDSRTFAAVRRYAEPTPRDLSFQALEWRDTVYEGIVEAQKKDRPILMWLYFGDPRGHC